MLSLPRLTRPMKIPQSIFYFIAWLAIHSVATATSVGVTTFGSQRLVQDSGSNLLLGANTFVWMGNFTTESFGASAFNPALSISANVAAMQSAGGWRQFGFDSNGTAEFDSNTLAINSASKLSGNIADTSVGADYFGKATPTDTRKIYLWIFKGTSISNATEMGIFRSPDAVSQPWTFPINGNVGSDVITLTTNSASNLTPTIVAIGGAGSATATRFQLSGTVTAVPEPSTLAFGVSLGLVAGYFRQRRKNK